MSSSILVSIIICTHNPRSDYLNRVLEALKYQTLSKDIWELLLVDNASEKILSSEIDLSWHSQARHIREEQLGLTPTRLRGIREAKAETLVFVDDDNILEANYLQEALHILQSMPSLGAIGGQIIPEYELSPPEWLFPYENKLAIRRIDRSVWSNNRDDWQAIPWGAGLVIRKNVCTVYSKALEIDPRRAMLDRKGDLLISGGDTDMALTCLELDLGFGVFESLGITHLISKRRLTEDYMLRLIRGLHTSSFLLPYLRGETIPQKADRKSLLYKEARRIYHLFFKKSVIAQKVEAAIIAGEDDFEQIILKLNKSKIFD